MKVAVCFFGLCGGAVAKNIESHKVHFPFDYFYGTWSDKARDIEQQLPGVPFITTPEPVMHYHPPTETLVDDNNPHLAAEIAMRKRWDASDVFHDKHEVGRHRTKQHLGHAYMLSQLPPEYDMVIRSRFDTRLSSVVDFAPYLQKSYMERRAIGFMGGWDKKPFDVLLPSGKSRPTFLHDILLMHPRDMFDVDLVRNLHESKRLAPSEAGWWQILSYPYGENHLNMDGGAILERWM